MLDSHNHCIPGKQTQSVPKQVVGSTEKNSL